ncbi:glycosyltransferase family 4 protein [Desulfatiglans anilini]|uniref:glycosyltransferase family 4 protein n=1 Tax=Desulfatiglans anilini TaxID=90728 RepID=UPI00041AEFFB|nr:glycosyltransferase family 4 protein [Desulfatiglans anilini]
MKILLASRGDITNPLNWSGTPYNLKNHFANIPGLHIDCLNWQTYRMILRIYHVIFSKLIFIYGSAKDPFLKPFCARTIKSRILQLKCKPDFVMFISDYIIPSSIAYKTKFAAYVDSFHEVEMQHYAGNRRGIGIWKRHYGLNNMESLQRMALIFTQNEWTRQCMMSAYGIDENKIHNVGFGVNVNPFLEEKNYQNNLLLIVLRKGTEKYKGLLLLLKAFRLLKKLRPDLHLAVVGTELDDRIDGVTYYFNQPRSVTLDLFRKATLYVMPALHEPNGITYLEALANKTPIVGLKRFALPEFTNNGEWGFMVEHEDANQLANVLNYALDNKELLRIMGLKGQDFVLKRYSWHKVVCDMAAIMRNYLLQK